MAKDIKYTAKLAVGIFVDGCYFRVVCLSKQKNKIKLIDAESLILNSPRESISAENEPLPQQTTIAPQDTSPIDITSDIRNTDSIATETELKIQYDESLEDDSIQDPPKIQIVDSVNPIVKPDNTHLEEEPSNVPLDIELMLAEQQSDTKSTEFDLTAEKQKADLGTASFEIIPETQDTDFINTEPDSEYAFQDSTDPSDSQKASIKDAQQQFESQDSASILLEILNRYPDKKYEIAISLAEPQIYYSHFDTDWGLTGKKLKQKIIEELSEEKSDTEIITPEVINTLKLEDNTLLAVVRESEIGVINLIKTISKSLKKRPPKISLVESAEISLVNVVKENYEFNEDEITVIVYAGNEFSRLIFMRGNELYHVSPIIGEGTDSYLVYGYSLSILANTIRSRLLLEQDELNLPKVDNIILAGEACRAEVKNVLNEWFEVGVNIEEIKFPNLDTDSVLPLVVKDLPQVAVAIGAAWRAHDLSNKELYSLDLTPIEIRNEQKVFKLGISGWLFLLLIPLLTFFATIKINQLSRNLHRLELQYQQKKTELARLQEIQTRVDAATKKLSYYLNTFGVLDSMVAGTQTWSEFLKKITTNAQNIGGVWITELGTISPDRANIKGYSLYRNRIPKFSEAIGNATLKSVQVQDIREKTVYDFEIEAKVPEKNIISSKVSAKKAEPILPENSKIKITEQDFKNKYQTGLDLFDKYKYQAAITQFDFLMKSNVRTNLKINCIYWIGECYFGLKNYNKAIEYFNKVAKNKSTKTPYALYMLGRSHAMLGNIKKSKEYFNTILIEYPKKPIAIKARSMLNKLILKR